MRGQFKPIVYAETSFWVRLTDRFDPERRRESRSFLEWCRGRCVLRASNLVVSEIRENPHVATRQAALRALGRARPRIVTSGPSIRRLADDLHRRRGRGEKGVADSTHLAYAIAVRARALVTWDVLDLAGPRTRELVRLYCEQHGWPVPMIGTPKEVREWHARGLL